MEIPSASFPRCTWQSFPFFLFLSHFVFFFFFSNYNLGHQVCAQQINICAYKPVLSSSVQHILTRERLVLKNLKTFGFMVLFTTTLVLLFAGRIPSDCFDRNLTLQSYLINHNMVLELGIACLISKAFLNTIRNLWSKHNGHFYYTVLPKHAIQNHIWPNTLGRTLSF